LEFVEFKSPFGEHLRADNRWVRLSEFIPWALIEEKYRESLSSPTRGQKAYSSRVAFGAIYIKEQIGLTDEDTVLHIQENPFLQYFLGFPEYRMDPPFDPSLMTHFRKRFTAESLQEINRRIFHDPEDHDNDDSPEEDDDNKQPRNRGKLILDATVSPADITFPTDLKLLNSSRECLEGIIDTLHELRPPGSIKPRTYRENARRDYLRAAKKRRAFGKLRKAIRKQLGYIRRDIDHVAALSEEVSLGNLSRDRYRRLLVIHEVYRQQKEMYDERKRKIPHRIVSISQPHVRPIKRGKAAANWEFGAKVSIGMTDGYTSIHQIGWDNFNESRDLIAQAEDYFRVHGVYPESIHADKIYRNRANLRFCKEKCIRLSGPPLGRPPKDEALRRALHRQWREDEQVRNAVEGKFGEAKRAYSLDRLKTKLQGTSETVISMVFLIMNMKNFLRKEASSCSSNVLRWLLAQLRGIRKMIRSPNRLCCSVEC
jgi:hypothetical protein